MVEAERYIRTSACCDGDAEEAQQEATKVLSVLTIEIVCVNVLSVTLGW